MKNVGLILNIVLLVAVGVLFYLHFSSPKKSSPAVVRSSSGTDSFSKDFRIAYFEMDSLTNSFQMIQDVQNELTREEVRMNNEMNRLQKTYNDKLSGYQNMGEMSQVQSEAASREMLQLQEKIRSQKENMDQEYQKLYMRKKQDVKTRIEDFLREYNSSKGYAYILTNEPGFIYYRDTIYNITNDLVKGLNDAYGKKEKK